MNHHRYSENRIHYASQLMRLRAQLRSPTLSSFNYRDLPTTARPEYVDDEEDDQESYNDDEDDNASQLTHLSELVRASIEKKQARHYSGDLALPPKIQSADKRSTSIPLRPNRGCFTSFALASEQLLRQEQQQSYYDDDDDDTCSTTSTDSWSDDDDTSIFGKRHVHSSPMLYNDSSSSLDSSSASTMVSEERRFPRPATAYFISLSPSAAAAASVARKRRWQARPTWKRTATSPLLF
ncbi:hypothetical protein BJV82DRAFT_582810 [Fennellomyces sp. T-0311]|nr:hypothetical protein BJV82DRAFT_582810 [Fennellomyces sp. T-0311]